MTKMTKDDVINFMLSNYDKFEWKHIHSNSFETVSNGITIYVIKKVDELSIYFSEEFGTKNLFIFPMTVGLYEKIGEHFMKMRIKRSNSIVSRALTLPKI